MITIILDKKQYTFTNLKYPTFELKTKEEFKNYVLKKGDKYHDEIAKYILYNYLLSKLLHKKIISKVETTILLILYSDLCVSRHYLVPLNIKFINTLDLTPQRENFPVVTINKIHLKALSNTSVECNITIQLNIPNVTSLNNTESMDFVIYNNTMVVKDTMHLISKEINKNKYVCNVDLDMVLTEFLNGFKTINKKRKRHSNMIDKMLFQEKNGNDLLRKINFDCNKSIFFSKISNSLFYENENISLGGIISCVDNHFTLFKNYMKKIEKQKKELQSNVFNGVVLICKSYNKKMFKSFCLQQNFFVYDFRHKSNNLIQNIYTQVIIISYEQINTENKKWMNNNDYLPLTINLNNEKCSLLYLRIERLFMIDTHSLTFNNTNTDLLSSLQCNKKWICTSSCNTQLKKIDIFLFYRWFQPNDLLFLDHQINEYSKAIIKVNDSQKVKELFINFTTEGINKIYKEPNISILKIVNEHRSIDNYCRTKFEEEKESCCICYESQSKNLKFAQFKCNHFTCVSCFLKLRKNSKLRCPLCRQLTKIPTEINILSKTNQTADINPYTNKIEFLFIELNFSPTIEGAIVCNMNQKLFIKSYFKDKPQMLNRLHFIKKSDALQMKCVRFHFVLFFNTSNTIFLKSNNINEKTFRLVDTIYTSF